MGEVIKSGRCVSCGACVASCPIGSLRFKEDNLPSMAGKCVLCEYCYYQCPHTDPASLRDIHASLFTGSSLGADNLSMDIGYYLRCYSAQSTSPEILSRSTNGGAVTSLLVHLMQEGTIDAAVVASNSLEKPWKSQATVALSPKEIIEASGTRFTMSPTPLSLASAVDEYDRKNIAVVALPCQLRAIRKMQLHPKGLLHVGKRVRMCIGLFCMQSFTYEGLMHELLEKQKQLNAADITKLGIRKGKLLVHERGVERLRVPLDEVKPYANKSCSFCGDYTAELADISVGAVGSPEGWSTVIVRTPQGKEAFESAVRNGKLICKSLDEVKPGLHPITALSVQKRKRLRPSL